MRVVLIRGSSLPPIKYREMTEPNAWRKANALADIHQTSYVGIRDGELVVDASYYYNKVSVDAAEPVLSPDSTAPAVADNSGGHSSKCACCGRDHR